MKSPFLPKQEICFPLVPHKETLFSAIMWFLKNKNPYCKSFCPTCMFYYRCQEDMAMMDEYKWRHCRKETICGTQVYIEKGVKKNDRD